VLIDNNNIDSVHHLLIHECNPSFTFDDANLPDGVCDEIATQVESCSSNIATVWAVGGDHVSFRIKLRIFQTKLTFLGC
jgi:hypothetical protein